nr:hypothetical protein [uncultured Desulfobacter sp.]
MAKSNCTQTELNEQGNKSSLIPDVTNGVIKLDGLRQMLFCVSQSEYSAREMSSSALLGVSAIMEESIEEIEQAYNHMIDNETRYITRHRKLRASLASYLESDLFCKSGLAKILADDEKEVPDAN